MKKVSFYQLSLWHLHWISGLYSASNLHNFCIDVYCIIKMSWNMLWLNENWKSMPNQNLFFPFTASNHQPLYHHFPLMNEPPSEATTAASIISRSSSHHHYESHLYGTLAGKINFMIDVGTYCTGYINSKCLIWNR